MTQSYVENIQIVLFPLLGNCLTPIYLPDETYSSFMVF